MKRNTLLTLGSLITLIALPNMMLAKEARKYPHGCRQVGFDFSNGQLHLKIITPDGLPQTLYLIHNKSPYEIMLKNAQSSKYIPNYEKKIPQDRWVAFGRDVNEITFACLTPDRQFLDCNEVIELCNYNNVKFPYTNVGTYWITNPGSQQEAMHGSISKGILLRW